MPRSLRDPVEDPIPVTLPANRLTLYDLEQRLQLQQTRDPAFFAEWRGEFSPYGG
ncbi:MAG: hypothetical protein AAFY20_11840 [Cyanobacteria bacterium J06639_14]